MNAYLSLAATIIIAVAGLVFTWLQIKQKEQEHKFKLYDERMKVYIAFMDTYSTFSGSGGQGDTAWHLFNEKVLPGKLLFNRRIRDLMVDTRKSVISTRSYNAELEGLEIGPERNKVVAKWRRQFDLTEDKFRALREVLEDEISPAESITWPWR